MSAGVFISGTDTGIGKTRFSCALVRGLRARGVTAVGMKPVASGSRQTASGLRNEDAEALIAAAGFTGNYDDINPFVFADPIAPHLAAQDHSTSISIDRIHASKARLSADHRFVVVEGVGGWLAPLGERLMQADIARAMELPVILVVGMRLGCINHALLTARAIAADGCQLIGWVANRVDPAMLRIEDNIESIRQRIQAPLFGIMEYAETPQTPIHRDNLDPAIAVLMKLEHDTQQPG